MKCFERLAPSRVTKKQFFNEYLFMKRFIRAFNEFFKLLSYIYYMNNRTHCDQISCFKNYYVFITYKVLVQIICI